jgi:hypothetical protein
MDTGSISIQFKMAITEKIQTRIEPHDRLRLTCILNKLGLSESEWLRGAARAQIRKDERKLAKDKVDA